MSFSVEDKSSSLHGNVDDCIKISEINKNNRKNSKLLQNNNISDPENVRNNVLEESLLQVQSSIEILNRVHNQNKRSNDETKMNNSN